MTRAEMERYEQLGRDFEAGRRVCSLTITGKLRCACPDKTDDEIHRMADEALEVSGFHSLIREMEHEWFR